MKKLIKAFSIIILIAITSISKANVGFYSEVGKNLLLFKSKELTISSENIVFNFICPPNKSEGNMCGGPQRQYSFSRK